MTNHITTINEVDKKISEIENKMELEVEKDAKSQDKSYRAYKTMQTERSIAVAAPLLILFLILGVIIITYASGGDDETSGNYLIRIMNDVLKLI